MASQQILINEKEILRGNTVAGVNAEIIKILLAQDKDFTNCNFLDVPCGNGEFLQTVEKSFPEVQLTGMDIKSPTQNFDGDFILFDAQNSTEFPFEKCFSAVTCISGVMEFDNTLNFFRNLKKVLDENGILIVTNDNLLTVRDRFLYLFFGRLRQFPLSSEYPQPTWKILPLQNLKRILHEADFVVEEIRYVSARKKEWLWLPLALPIFALQKLYLSVAEKSFSADAGKKLFPFKSLFSRHYILVCRMKKPVNN